VSSINNALTILMIGSIVLFAMSCWNIVDLFLFFPIIYVNLDLLAYYGLQFVASLLLMIGFIVFRGELLKLVSQSRLASVTPSAPLVQSVPMRFCPQCGRQIPVDAQSCSFCGWQAEKRKK
jgi:hypothetical protein